MLLFTVGGLLVTQLYVAYLKSDYVEFRGVLTRTRTWLGGGSV